MQSQVWYCQLMDGQMGDYLRESGGQDLGVRHLAGNGEGAKLCCFILAMRLWERTSFVQHGCPSLMKPGTRRYNCLMLKEAWIIFHAFDNDCISRHCRSYAISCSVVWYRQAVHQHALCWEELLALPNELPNDLNLVLNCSMFSGEQSQPG